MRIALITYHFPESTIPLAKNLASEDCIVDYYYILQYRLSQNLPGFDFSNAKLKFGINKLSHQDAPETFKYIGDSLVNIFIILIYIPPKLNIRLLRNIFLNRVINKINTINYDFINIVGQDKFLIKFHEKLICQKRVHTLHEVTNHHLDTELNSPLLNYLFLKKVKIIVHSNESYKKICLYKACNKDFVFKIPFGLFETYRHYSPVYFLSKPLRYVLFFGYIRPYKGLDIFLRAVELLNGNFPEIKFVVAGSGYLPELEALKKSERFIVINKHISNSELLGLIDKSHFIICPYKSGSQTGITKLAFLCGKPVLASEVGSFNEEIIDGQNGLLVEPNSPTEISAALSKMIKDEKLYENMLLEIKELQCNSSENWKNIAQKNKAVYLSVLSIIFHFVFLQN